MLAKKAFFQEIVTNAVRIFIVLVAILPITELFRLLDSAASGNIPLVTLLTLMIYGTIASFPMVITIASFLAIVITLNRWCKDQEFVIWAASGLSPFYWLRQVLWFSIPIAAICGISTLYVYPWATVKSHEYANYLSHQQITMAISPGVFREADNGNQVFYVEKFSLNPGVADKVFIQYFNPKDNSLKLVTASSGKVINQNGLITVELNHGSIYELPNGINNIAEAHFKNFMVNIATDYVPLTNTQEDSHSAPISYLLNHFYDNHRARAEVMWRTSIAIMMLLMCLIAVPISIQVGRRQNNLVFVLTPIIYAVYENFILTLNGQLVDNPDNSILPTVLVHLLVLLLALLITYIKTFPQGYLFSRNKH